MSVEKSDANFTVDYVGPKRYPIRQDDEKRAYIYGPEMRKDGERWTVHDFYFRQVCDLRGSSKDQAVIRAIAMVRRGEMEAHDKRCRDERVQGQAAINALMRKVALTTRPPSLKRLERHLTLLRSQEIIAKQGMLISVIEWAKELTSRERTVASNVDRVRGYFEAEHKRPAKDAAELHDWWRSQYGAQKGTQKARSALDGDLRLHRHLLVDNNFVRPHRDPPHTSSQKPIDRQVRNGSCS
jgi:hypothetical protein